MSRLGYLTEDEKARYDALTFRRCQEDYCNVSMCDCPADCEDIQETEVEVQAVVKKIWGECGMNEKELVEWTIVPPMPQPPPPLELQRPEGITATVEADGRVEVGDGNDILEFTTTRDLRGLIASLQSILVLAKEHFGEDWGKCGK